MKPRFQAITAWKILVPRRSERGFPSMVLRGCCGGSDAPLQCTQEQLKAQIRFHLAELAAGNRHHQFELLCYEIARKRICSNLVFPTGPVSAGGDQGRDFESFKTYLATTALSENSFLGLVQRDTVVFACTTQRTRLRAKVLADVATICGGDQVDRIYVCLAHPLAVGRQRAIQRECRSRHAVAVEIFDQHALADFLVEPDLFYLAGEFLGIPADMYPEQERPDWYDDIARHLRDSNVCEHSYKYLMDLTLCARFSVREKSVAVDLPLWLERLHSLASECLPDRIGMKAAYEIVVCGVRGSASLAGVEGVIERYLVAAASETDPGLIEDANIALDFLAHAVQRNTTAYRKEHVRNWLSMIATQIDRLLDLGPTTGHRCVLLGLKGYAVLRLGDAHDAACGTEVLRLWREAAGAASECPWYPVDSLAQRVSASAPLLCDHTDYTPLTDQIDKLMADRAGDRRAAESARDRAVVLHEAGRIARAIKELHVAKIKWFSHDTRPELLLTMLVMADWYRELRLSFASKYYALAAAHVATTTDDPSVLRFAPRALMLAADADFSIGAWMGYVTFLEKATSALSLVSSAERVASGDLWREALRRVTVVQHFASRVVPEATGGVVAAMARVGLDELIQQSITALTEALSDCGTSQDDCWASIEKELAWRPYHDAVLEREVVWSEFGVEWHAVFPNDYVATIQVEEFLSSVQIVLLELGTTYLGLLPTRLRITFAVVGTDSVLVETDGSGEWRVQLPQLVPGADATTEQYEVEMLSAIMTILCSVSVLPDKEWLQIVDDVMRDGLRSKMVFGQPYHRCYETFVTKDDFDRQCRLADPQRIRTGACEVTSHPDLGWPKGRAPDYSEADAQERVRLRYARSIPPIRTTLQRLREDENFQATLRDLRACGWRDWHVLQAVASAVANHRARAAADSTLTLETFRLRMLQALDAEEDERSVIVPADAFERTHLILHLRGTMLSTMKGLGLVLRQRAVDFEAVERFIAERYNYWEDDVPHQDPFQGE